MPILRNRVVRATVSAAAEFDDGRVVENPKNLSWSDHRINFTVEQNVDSDPNTAVVKIYNLSPPARRFCRELGDKLILEAGHESRSGIVFVGDIRRVETSWRGPDSITEIHAGDGEKHYVRNRVSISLGPGTSRREAFDQVADALGLEVGIVSAAADMAYIYANGITLVGNAASILSGLVEAAGARWSIQDGRLQVLVSGEANQTSAILVTSDTNLVSSPRLLLKKKKHSERIIGLGFRIILEPGLYPGRSVRLKAREFDGVYVAERVKHYGDSGWEDDFYSDFEGPAVGGGA